MLEEAQALFERLADHIDVWEESLRAADAAADGGCGLTAPGVETQTLPPPLFPAQWLWVRAAYALLDRDEEAEAEEAGAAAGDRGGRGGRYGRRHSGRKGSPRNSNWVGHVLAGSRR